MATTDEAPQHSLISAQEAAPSARSLCDIFGATVTHHAHRVALDASDATLTYRELADRAESLADTLREHGVGPGDRVGVRIPSGTSELYIAILGVLHAGAAYVPVEAEDPPARADAILEAAAVCGTLGEGLAYAAASEGTGAGESPAVDDDAWIIFTSGSTGAPKGVAVTHRSAAAFIDAERLLWEVRPDDRVLAGLSVAFDASCEEMWLAWGSGAALVPAPRAIVRSGADLGTWLAGHRVSVISTVPTLAAMWDEAVLEHVRLLILGGEACPAELGWRLAERCEVWNTYGPTEATVVSTATPIRAGEPLTIGWPLAGWDVAVVAEDGEVVPVGEPGELVIGGVGLGRYLDPALDAERYAPLESLGWERAYRSGDIVRETVHGLEFVGRRDQQVKLGGRRLELGEVEAQLCAVPGVRQAAALVQRTAGGNPILVGYVTGEVSADDVRAQVAEQLPDGLAPLVVVLESMPMSTSGKVDRKALPWPPADAPAPTDTSLGETAGWLAARWTEQLGPVALTADSDFFACGGSSLIAAKLVSVLRERFPAVAVSDVYEHRRLGQLAARLERLGDIKGTETVDVPRPPRWWGPAQLAGVLLLVAVQASQLVVAGFIYSDLVGGGLPQLGWVWVLAGWLALCSPPGRAGLVLLASRLLLGRTRAGRYPRHSSFGWRLWFVDRLAEVCHNGRVAGTPWAARYARSMGARVGAGARLGSVPRAGSLVSIGAGATLEGTVDMHGWWIDGQEIVIDEIHIGAGARIGTRVLLMPGAQVGEGAEIEPGAVVSGRIPAGERWAGAPARYVGTAGDGWPARPPQDAAHPWRERLLFGLGLSLRGTLATVAFLGGVALLAVAGLPDPTLHTALSVVALEVLIVSGVFFLGYALLTAGAVRLLGRMVKEGWHSERGTVGWALWLTEDLMHHARDLLFPLFASVYTRSWLRLMGFTVGKGTEVSVATGLNRLVRFGERSFVTDDVVFATARGRDGWIHVGAIEVGDDTFLGNGALIAPGTQIGSRCLVGIHTPAPQTTPDGTSWFGSPAIELPRVPDETDPARTTRPPARLVAARATMDLIRILVPSSVSLGLGWFALLGLDAIGARHGVGAELALAPLVLFATGVAAALLTVGVKWLLMGRYRTGEHPFWSLFVWRDELMNSTQEQLANMWLMSTAAGTPLLSLFLRALGAKVGRGVWCETLAITEFDVVEIADGAALNRGTCLMTHLFHDRLMRIGPATLEPGATLGPGSVTLPDTTLGRGTSVGGSSVVMRGEQLPAGTRWHGAPVVCM